MTAVADNFVATCIDFRIQEIFDDWVENHLKIKSFDRFEYPGCTKDLATLTKQVTLSKDLHKIKNVYLMNHEDCGAYGPDATKPKHLADLKAAKEKINLMHPDLKVETYFIFLDGTIEKVE